MSKMTRLSCDAARLLGLLLDGFVFEHKGSLNELRLVKLETVDPHAADELLRAGYMTSTGYLSAYRLAEAYLKGSLPMPRKEGDVPEFKERVQTIKAESKKRREKREARERHVRNFYD